jgi:hypothetical protein
MSEYKLEAVALDEVFDPFEDHVAQPETTRHDDPEDSREEPVNPSFGPKSIRVARVFFVYYTKTMQNIPNCL